jgi:heme oxygenase
MITWIKKKLGYVSIPTRPHLVVTRPHPQYTTEAYLESLAKKEVFEKEIEKLVADFQKLVNSIDELDREARQEIARLRSL